MALKAAKEEASARFQKVGHLCAALGLGPKMVLRSELKGPKA